MWNYIETDAYNSISLHTYSESLYSAAESASSP